ncbi:MAG: hypothetical protein MUO64_02480 [Anaerolineales bacterium]|nr:hypothetical protein [Anaerolineales bacterium]
MCEVKQLAQVVLDHIHHDLQIVPRQPLCEAQRSRLDAVVERQLSNVDQLIPA